MATLILTTLGSVLGGPIGGAIGAIVGQAIDQNVLFKPQGREGPRLTELAVQTSSYGAPIPRLFGTMRVAGTVIWSTDLIESKTKTSAKGQPTVTSYNYSASFAVLLSARAISGVGRIWADGNLLRGAAGDFKTATDFRLHTGGEAQPIDPLIAAAEGAEAPAHRGHAYAVFENFQLGDYGNRIPSLTFEVIADDAPVSLGVIAAALGDGLIDGQAITMPVPGFSAYGDSVRGVLETLAVAGGAWFAPVGARLAMRNGAETARTIEDAGVAAGERAARRTRMIAAIETVPQTITIGHYDPARDYQTGLQRARRPGAGVRQDRIEMPAALAAGTAKAIAEAELTRAEAARTHRQISLGWDAIDILPGDRIAIAGESGRWRASGWSLEAMVVALDLVRLPDLEGDVTAGGSASSGRVIASPDLQHGPTILHAFELPPIDDALPAMPRLFVAAAGIEPGWRRAALLYSIDDGARWIGAGRTAPAAVIGMLASAMPPGSVSLRDLETTIEVTLLHEAMTLAGANDGLIDGGANLALVGEELIQFGGAEQIGPARWRLSRLLRGRRGTEAKRAAHRPGDRFLLIDPDTLAIIDVPLAVIGGQMRVLASGIGDIDGPVPAASIVTGVSVLPPSPVHVRIDTAATSAPVLRWARRSRAGWRWIDGGDVPLIEEREAYRITVSPSGAAFEVHTPDYPLGADDRIAGAVLDVRQLGSNGQSPAATITMT